MEGKEKKLEGHLPLDTENAVHGQASEGAQGTPGETPRNTREEGAEEEPGSEELETSLLLHQAVLCPQLALVQR